jgi:hypothetical protein
MNLADAVLDCSAREVAVRSAPTLWGRALTDQFEKPEEKDRLIFDFGEAHVYLDKKGAAPEVSQELSGVLYLAASDWLLLSVPNALGQGAFSALSAPGIQLPTDDNGRYNAHISVIRPEELESIGGAQKIKERNHRFHYTLGPVKKVRPAEWDGVEQVWFIEVHSPELERLRRSYGLSSLPNKDKYKFHITFAIRKSGVLGKNTVAKD